VVSKTENYLARDGRLQELQQYLRKVQTIVTRDSELIKTNVLVHEAVASTYDDRHPEIFNPIEQTRLRNLLAVALNNVQTGERHAMDYGCGTGNLTRHLLDLGCTVTAADVTPSFVQMTTNIDPQGVTGLILNGRDMCEIEAETFDLIATYSVLHHIPDYLSAVREMIRVLKPGGVLVIDHEASDEHYEPGRALAEFRELTVLPRTLSWYTRRVFSLGWWRTKWLQRSNPRYSEEGDIHVWPDDRIEWHLLRALFEDSGVEILRDESYLHAQAHYDPAVFTTYADMCSDMHVLVGRKR